MDYNFFFKFVCFWYCFGRSYLTGKFLPTFCFRGFFYRDFFFFVIQMGACGTELCDFERGLRRVAIDVYKTSGF